LTFGKTVKQCNIPCFYLLLCSTLYMCILETKKFMFKRCQSTYIIAIGILLTSVGQPQIGSWRTVGLYFRSPPEGAQLHVLSIWVFLNTKLVSIINITLLRYSHKKSMVSIYDCIVFAVRYIYIGLQCSMSIVHCNMVRKQDGDSKTQFSHSHK